LDVRRHEHITIIMDLSHGKEPWLLRNCSERQRKIVTFIGGAIGILGYGVYFFGGLLVIVFGPAAFAMWRPDAPISRPIIWLGRAVGPTAFMVIYFSVMVAVAFILMWGIRVHDYTDKQRKRDA